MDYRRTRFPLPLLGALGLVVGLLIVGGIAAPRVVAFSPDTTSYQVPGTTRVAITFSRPMDMASVEAHLSIEPATPGRFVWQGMTLTFQPTRPWPGAATVTIRLQAGARSLRLLPLLTSQVWTFTISVPRICYLWPAGSPADLYLRSIDGTDTVRLTETALGVYDYSLGSDGSTLVYAAERNDGGTDLRLLNLTTGTDSLAFACPAGARCRAPALSPNGQILAFEQFDLEGDSAAGRVPGPTHVWEVDLSQPSTVFLVGPEDNVSSMPTWSPAGVLAYFDSALRAITLVDASTGPTPAVLRYLPSDLGPTGSWSPDGAFLIFPEIVFPSGQAPTEGSVQFYSHVFRAEVSSGQIVDLWRGGMGLVEDASPVYSPDGQWIAFARKYLEQDRWSLGRQLWIMRADGSSARALTDEPDFNHSSLAWSPDSSTLVYMRFDETNPTQASEIWLIGADGQGAESLVVGGYLPRWIP
jgi:Tol biopolymer transport system component